MDALTQKSRQRRLKRELTKSLARLRLSKNKKLTIADKSKIKKVAVKSLQRFLAAEIKRTNTKTYDWYFNKTQSGRIVVETPRRNNLGYNRYFIIDYFEVPIESATAFASTFTQQRVREFSISSKEISDIISGSKHLFDRMLTVTVSEKEDAKIWASFDNVDEKTIFAVTVGLPLAIILSAEAVPLMVMASESSAATSLSTSVGEAFVVNSGKVAAINGGIEFGGQYFSNALIYNDWSLNRIDWIDVGSNAAFSKGGDLILGSAMDFSFQDGFQLHTDKKLGENLLLGYGKTKLNSKIGSGLSKTVGQYSPILSDFISNSVQLNVSVMIDATQRSSEKN